MVLCSSIVPERGSQHVRHLCHEGNRGEVPHRVVVELAIQVGADRKRRGSQHDRIAVRWLLRRELGADVAARAGAVFRHHRLAKVLGQLLTEQPPESDERGARLADGGADPVDDRRELVLGDDEGRRDLERDAAQQPA